MIPGFPFRYGCGFRHGRKRELSSSENGILLYRILCLSLILFSGCSRTATPYFQGTGTLFSLPGIPPALNGTYRTISEIPREYHESFDGVLPPGASLTIGNIEGAGVISRIWLSFHSGDPFVLRNLILRIYWDGEQEPSVFSPAGDFFGVGFGHCMIYESLVSGMTGNGMFCYFPMPFEKRAFIRLDNEGDEPVEGIRFQIGYYALKSPSKNPLYFHAAWRRERATKSNRNFQILTTDGRGYYVGCVLSMQGKGSNFRFLKGGEAIFVDGEKSPSIKGTHTLDSFNFDNRFISPPSTGKVSGITVYEPLSLRLSAYNYRVHDPVPFHRKIRVTFEHGERNTSIADYSSVAFWYQHTPVPAEERLFKKEDRIPLLPRDPLPKDHIIIEAEQLVPPLYSSGDEVVVENMGLHGVTWSNSRQLIFRANRTGDYMILAFEVREAGNYLMKIRVSRMFEGGIYDIFLDQQHTGYRIDTYTQGAPWVDEILLDRHILTAGTHRIRFETAGKNIHSKGYFLGLDACILAPSE
jgi:hypothetical protein